MSILGMGPLELLLIVVLALIVFGPAKLPEIMSQVGKAINDFRRATSELSDEFNRTIQAELQETKSVIDETKSSLSDVHATVNSAVTGMPAPTRTAVPDALPEPAPNGISAEPHSEPLANGTVGAPVVPPLADTAQWSWETSAPKAAATDTAATDPVASEPAATEPAATEIEGPAKTVKPAPPSPERAAHDDLTPPY